MCIQMQSHSHTYTGMPKHVNMNVGTHTLKDIHKNLLKSNIPKINFNVQINPTNSSLYTDDILLADHGTE